MIVYNLKCPDAHVFEAWFRDSAGYERQASAGEIACPICGSRKIGKAPMAPNIASKREGVNVNDTERHGEILGRLRALRAEVEKNSEHVGRRFPEEARKIHYGETAPRSIHGDADRKEAEALRDEGIDVQVIPWVPRADG